MSVKSFIENVVFKKEIIIFFEDRVCYYDNVPVLSIKI